MNKYSITLAHYKRKLAKKAADFNCIKDFPDYLEKLTEDLSQVNILDVGSGPFCIIGNKHPTKTINITACDILADHYNNMMNKAKIKPIILVEKQDMEQLMYPDNTFDIVHCINALDHTENLVNALKEFYRVCKMGGYIYLKHFPNSGQHRNYDGLHRWNICLNNNDFIAWNNHVRLNINDIFPFNSSQDKRSIISILKKI